MTTEPESPARPHRQDRLARARVPAPGLFLTFRIDAETYAVSVLEASEVLEYRAPTPVPGAPSWVPGMLSLRGKPVPVMDLGAKFGGDARRATASACVVVLDLVVDEEPTQIGVLVDDMPAVQELGGEQIVEPPRFGTLVHARYLRGMARLESGLVLLLDAAGALSAEDAALLAVLEARAAGGAAPANEQPAER